MIKGSCLCRAIRFEGGRIAFFAHCHCSMCRKAHGAAFATFAGIPAGLFDDDPGARPTMHMFVGSKAPWWEINDDLPRHEAYPPE